MKFGHYTVFDTPEENKHTQVYVEYDVPNNDNLEGATGTIVLTEGGQGSGGGGDTGSGIMSISISPAITTTPALNSVFPIYYEDLTEGERESGKQIVAEVGSAISAGDEFAVTVTPTSDVYAAMYDDEHGYHQGEAAGESLTLTLTAQSNEGMVGFPISCAVSESDDSDALFNVTIIIVYRA